MTTREDRRPPGAADLSSRNLTKILADQQHGMPDQAGIFDCSLAMLDRLAIDRVPDHLGEGRDTGIFRDEAMIPALLGGSNQHQFEPALPDDPAAQPLEH